MENQIIEMLTKQNEVLIKQNEKLMAILEAFAAKEIKVIVNSYNGSSAEAFADSEYKGTTTNGGTKIENH